MFCDECPMGGSNVEIYGNGQSGGGCGSATCWAGFLGLISVGCLIGFGVGAADSVLSSEDYILGGAGSLLGICSAAVVAGMADSQPSSCGGMTNKALSIALVFLVGFLLVGSVVGTHLITNLNGPSMEWLLNSSECQDNFWFDGDVTALDALENVETAYDVKYHVDLDYHDGAWKVDTSQTKVIVDGENIDLDKVDFGDNGKIQTITLDNGETVDVSDVKPTFNEDMQVDLKTELSAAGEPTGPAIEHLPEDIGRELTLSDAKAQLINARKLVPVTESGLDVISPYESIDGSIKYWVGDDFAVFKDILALNETFEIDGTTYQLVEANPGDVTNELLNKTGMKVVNLDALAHPPKRRRLAECGPVSPSFKAADVLRQRRRMMRDRKPNRTESVLRKMLDGAF